MAVFHLKAATTALSVSDASEQAVTNVEYRAPHQIFIWRRVNNDPWTREDLIEGARSSAQAAVLERQGTRETPPLRAGEFVSYGMIAEASADPNRPNFNQSKFDAFVLVDVLLAESALIDATVPDTGLLPGGTFVRNRVATTQKTRLRMWVNPRSPSEDPHSLFEAFLGTPPATKYSPLGTVHDVTAEPLIAGTRYTAHTLVVTESGAWQHIRQEFETKRRKVAIKWLKFEVTNDSDEGAWGAGDDVAIRLRVFSGDDMIKELNWGPGDLSDEDDEDLVLIELPETTVGPDSFNGKDPGLGFSLYGREEDGLVLIPLIGVIPMVDEAQFQQAGNQVKRFDFPVGRSKEAVTPPTTEANFEITAVPVADDDSELRLTAKLRVAVSYE